MKLVSKHVWLAIVVQTKNKNKIILQMMINKEIENSWTLFFIVKKMRNEK